MKRIIGIVLIISALISCQENESSSDFTGNEITYQLVKGSDYDISGTVVIKERKDGTATVEVNLTGTEGNGRFPVHLHKGSISAPDADVAALLKPVHAETGISETVLTNLADESPVRYADLIAMDACIKVHLSDTGLERNIILAGGNIGASVGKASASGREGFAVCKSN